MLAVTSLIPKYDLEALCGGVSKDWVTRKVEEAVHNFVHTSRILLRTRENSCSRWRAVSYGTWRNPYTNNPGREWGRMLDAYFKMLANKRFVQREENARGEGVEGSL